MRSNLYVLGDSLKNYERFTKTFFSLSKPIIFQAGECIVSMGDYFSGFYLIRSGLVEVRYTNENGQTKILQLHNGPFVIGASCIDNHQNMLDYNCLTPVEAAYMPKEKFQQWDFEMLLDFSKIQTDKVRILNQQIQDAQNYSNEQRVLRILWEYALTIHTTQMVPLHIDGLKKQTIADLLSITNVQLSSILRRLEKKGYLLSHSEKQGITILKLYSESETTYGT